ncbi:hypothetical protein NP233_g1770 [Leucocoprinus birnbaumii]|uniref:RRM domain-containing protein n=1 Tax=Leucocoprinus birnbaumii TaxID=56174 RepID=A0AAD5YUJ1_9AGAR|nr:hypothetical protein NP233_g1770 [Leucocoprinus birnbaumii]
MDPTTVSPNALSSDGIQPGAAQKLSRSQRRKRHRHKPQPALSSQPTNPPINAEEKVKKRPVAPSTDAEAADNAIASSSASATVVPKLLAPALSTLPRRTKKRESQPEAVALASEIAVPVPRTDIALESKQARQGALHRINQARINRLVKATVDSSNPISIGIPGPSSSQLHAAHEITPIIAPAPAPSTTTAEGSSTPPPASTSANKTEHPAYQAAQAVNTPAVFIKGVVDPVTSTMLSTSLTARFGAPQALEVVCNKACAFVEFSSVDVARRAIIASMNQSQGGEGGVYIKIGEEQRPVRIYIEARRERRDRPSARPRMVAPPVNDDGMRRGAGKSSKAKAQVTSQKQLDVILTPEEKAARKQEQKEKRLSKKAKRKEDHLNFVMVAANATLSALNKHGLSGAVFGSLACKLYGTFREPKDVDMLILQPPDAPRTAEELPRDPAAPYRILHYRSRYSGQDCKVDILIPGTMYLPDLFPYSVRRCIAAISNIPLVPFSLLLLHKLQGWADHIVATEEHKRRKHVQDAADVRRLLEMEERLEVLKTTQPWSNAELFCEEFQELTRERVKDYCKAFPKRAAAWKLLGFDTVVSEEVLIYDAAFPTEAGILIPRVLCCFIIAPIYTMQSVVHEPYLNGDGNDPNCLVGASRSWNPSHTALSSARNPTTLSQPVNQNQPRALTDPRGTSSPSADVRHLQSAVAREGGSFSNAHNFTIMNAYMNDNSRTEILTTEGQEHTFLREIAAKALPSAMLDSKDRGYIPRCNEDTRRAFRHRVIKWATDVKESRHLLWLSGPAAVGKSAVAQTVAEELKEKELLGAVFFFSRPHNRSDPDVVIPTLVYQLALQVPEYKRVVTQKVIKDPLTLNRSRKSQFKDLIVDPFLLLVSNGSAFVQATLLVVLDGLDECKERGAQAELVKMISHYMYKEPSLPLRWMICSRPEPHIKAAFASNDSNAVCLEMKLEVHDNEAQRDARRILTKGFLEIRKRYPDQVPDEWPNKSQLQLIADRASGHLGFVSFIIRFIGDQHYDDPSGQLDVCLRFLERTGRGPGSEDPNPLYALDLLYTRILSDISKVVLPTTRRILGVLMFYDNKYLTVAVLANFLGLNQAAFYRAVQHLHSVLSIPPALKASKERIQIYHTSFSDYLKDSVRAGSFVLDEDAVHLEVANQGLEWLGHRCQNSAQRTLPQPAWSLPMTVPEDLISALCKFSFTTCWEAFPRVSIDSLPTLMETLERFDFLLDYPNICKYETRQFACFIRWLATLRANSASILVIHTRETYIAQLNDKRETAIWHTDRDPHNFVLPFVDGAPRVEPYIVFLCLGKLNPTPFCLYTRRVKRRIHSPEQNSASQSSASKDDDATAPRHPAVMAESRSAGSAQGVQYRDSSIEPVRRVPPADDGVIGHALPSVSATPSHQNMAFASQTHTSITQGLSDDQRDVFDPSPHQGLSVLGSSSSPGTAAFSHAHDFIIGAAYVVGNLQLSGSEVAALEKLARKGSMSAMLDSAERSYPPRCNPDTRQRVRQRIIQWGIAYQIATQHSDYRRLVTQRLAEDPAILDRNRQTQFRCLILDPVQLITAKNQGAEKQSLVIIVGGLDECEDRLAQREFVELISRDHSRTSASFLRWMICSRPEPDLKVAFSSAVSQSVCLVEELDAESIEAQQDAKCILRDGFSDMRMDYPDQLPADWPDEDRVDLIACSAAGHLGFVSFILGFIGDKNYDDPSGRLQVCLRFLRGMGERDAPNPLKALDLLYSQILSDIPKSVIPVTQRILGMKILYAHTTLSALARANILGLDQSSFYLSIQRLHSPGHSGQFALDEGAIHASVAIEGIQRLRHESHHEPGKTVYYHSYPISQSMVYDVDTRACPSVLERYMATLLKELDDFDFGIDYPRWGLDAAGFVCFIRGLYESWHRAHGLRVIKVS